MGGFCFYFIPLCPHVNPTYFAKSTRWSQMIIVIEQKIKLPQRILIILILKVKTMVWFVVRMYLCWGGFLKQKRFMLSCVPLLDVISKSSIPASMNTKLKISNIRDNKNVHECLKVNIITISVTKYRFYRRFAKE